jgi:hypothetical protein
MADQLDKIVQVVIERQTRVPSMKSFNEHLVAAEFNPVGITPIFDPEHRVRVFGSLDEIAAAGFQTNGFVYRAASKQYSQSNHIGNMYVGWKIPDGVYDVGVRIVGEWKPGNYLAVRIAGIPLDTIYYDEMGNADAMIDQLVKEFNAEFNDTKAIKVSATELRIYGVLKESTVEIEGGTERPTLEWFDRVSGKKDPGMNFSPYPADANWTEALTSMKAQNNEWYAVSVSARMMANQQECAQWIQANKKLGGLTSGDSTISDDETGDIAAWAKLNNLDRVFVFFHPDAKLADAVVDIPATTDPIPEAAYFGKMLTKKPGSATWKFKELQNVPTYELTQGQVKNVEDKNATWYMTTADVPMTSNGQVASGEYIDVIHGLDWLEARIQNLVFTALIGVDKVPFTDEGVQMVISPLKAALEEGKKNGILASYEVSYPAVIDVSVTDKGQRFLPDVEFTGVLAGAIHSTKIHGVVTL